MARWVLIAALVSPTAAIGQTASRPIHLQEFLDLVSQTNLQLAATRFNITVADAQITLARLRPDPQLGGGIAALDLTSQNLPTATTYGLSQTIELGGKRGSRIEAAKAGRSLAEAQLEDFFQQLRADATSAFIDALTARQVLERKRRTLESVERLVAATEQRLRAGDVGQTALWQVKVEGERFRGEVFAAEGASEAANVAVESFLVPQTAEGTVLEPVGDLKLASRQFDAASLISDAVARRSDVLVSIRAAQLARAQVDVAYANRWIDPSLAAGITQSPAGAASQTPAARALGLTLSLPVPFSRMTHGELDAAKALAGQAEVQTLSVKRRVEIEVRQSLARYQSSQRTVAVYAGEVLSNADRALEATRYSYERGNARLVELLDAQRTVDDVYLSYLAALSENAKALVALERASGRWDIQF
jgi:cobalt-zinc-cadmium efflux system outer membrane protein